MGRPVRPYESQRIEPVVKSTLTTKSQFSGAKVRENILFAKSKVFLHHDIKQKLVDHRRPTFPHFPPLHQERGKNATARSSQRSTTRKELPQRRCDTEKPKLRTSRLKVWSDKPRTAEGQRRRTRSYNAVIVYHFPSSPVRGTR